MSRSSASPPLEARVPRDCSAGVLLTSSSMVVYTLTAVHEELEVILTPRLPLLHRRLLHLFRLCLALLGRLLLRVQLHRLPAWDNGSEGKLQVSLERRKERCWVEEGQQVLRLRETGFRHSPEGQH